MIKYSVRFLRLANGLLLALAWAMAGVAYPRLPQKIPLWLNFAGQPVIQVHKSCLFFIYPSVQTLFVAGFWLLAKRVFLQKRVYKEEMSSLPEGAKAAFLDLKREFVFLTLLFFNLIFIHLQRSLILLSHRLEKGVDSPYFFTLFGVIMILIPYYRLRANTLGQKWK